MVTVGQFSQSYRDMTGLPSVASKHLAFLRSQLLDSEKLVIAPACPVLTVTFGAEWQMPRGEYSLA